MGTQRGWSGWGAGVVREGVSCVGTSRAKTRARASGSWTSRDGLEQRARVETRGMGKGRLMSGVEGSLKSFEQGQND